MSGERGPHRVDIEHAVETAVAGLLDDPDGRDLETERDNLLAVIYCWRDEQATDARRAAEERLDLDAAVGRHLVDVALESGLLSTTDPEDQG